MPTYDYQCRACGSVTEVIHSMLEDGPTVCERCGGVLRRVLYPSGIIFKGSGFYRTDSRATSGASGGSDSTSTSGDGSAPATKGTDAGSSGSAGSSESPGSSGSTTPATSGSG